MPTFKDLAGREWTIRFDGLLLDELRTERGIDLTDLIGSVYVTLEHDAALLTRALCFLCRDEIEKASLTPRQFAANIAGAVLDSAFAAILQAAQDFFPPRQWSGMHSRYCQQTTMLGEWVQAQPILAVLNRPEVSPSLREAMLRELASSLRPATTPTTTASSNSAAAESATGRAVTRSRRRSASPATAEPAPAA